MTFSADRLDRFARQIIIPEIGGAGQFALSEAHVVLVGLGGIGSPALQYLAGAGVGRLTLIDDGKVEASNLQRQTIFSERDVGHGKAVAARRWLVGHGRVWLATAFGLWVCAMLSKEIGAIWPLVLLGYDRLVIAGDVEVSRQRWRRVLGPLLGLTVVAGLVRVAVLILVENSDGAQVIWRYAFVEVEVIFRYFSMLLWTGQQSIFHQVSEVTWPTITP